ncbi:hypothetical protein J6590_070414 [Homalodisca vitripennis]|nr:hypothetical protein J6590_070414 [Homalodisca vitripennis]
MNGAEDKGGYYEGSVKGMTGINKGTKSCRTQTISATRTRDWPVKLSESCQSTATSPVMRYTASWVLTVTIVARGEKGHSVNHATLCTSAPLLLHKGTSIRPCRRY